MTDRACKKPMMASDEFDGRRTNPLAFEAKVAQ